MTAAQAIVTVENIASFAFDIVATCEHTLESDITDHYIEDNSFIQDHWALKPEKIVLKNFQGESVYTNTTSKIKVKLLPKLEIGGVDSTSTLTQNNNEMMKNIIKTTLTQEHEQLKNDIIKISKEQKFNSQGAPIPPPPVPTFSSSLPQLNTNANTGNFSNARQKYAYDYFKKLRANRTLVSCVTPFGSFSNMAIDKIVAFQDEDTKTMSSFTITLKEIRFADTILVSFSQNKYQSRNGIQQAPQVKNKAQSSSQQSPDSSALLKGAKAGSNLLKSTISLTFPKPSQISTSALAIK